VYDTSTNFLNVHEWAYGLTEIAHILSLAVGVGLIALVDLRLLGVGVGRASAERLWRATAVVSLMGLIVAVTTGLMIFSTDPIRYFQHPTMRFKLVLVLVALAFNYTVHSRVARGRYPRLAVSSVAVLSLVMWVTVVFSGIFYAFT
jgi:type III secretory pathway component EscS